jgi:hypothetical protein
MDAERTTKGISCAPLTLVGRRRLRGLRVVGDDPASAMAAWSAAAVIVDAPCMAYAPLELVIWSGWREARSGLSSDGREWRPRHFRGSEPLTSGGWMVG